MKKKTWILGGAVALALVALMAWAFAPRPVAVETAQAVDKPFESTVDEDGKTRVRDRYVLSAPLAGQLARIGLREGDEVKAGDVVAVLAPALSPLLDERTMRAQQARLEGAQAAVERATARIERAQVGLQQSRAELQRSQQLASQGFVSATKLDTDRLAVQASQKELEAALQERHVAGHDVDQARAALLAVQRPGEGGRGGFELRSPVAGRVLRVHQTSETTVGLGTPLVELGDTAQMEIVAELLTTDALQARPGSPVVIERWGGPGTLQGRVRRVEPGAFTKVSALGVEEQRVRVLIDIASPPEQWRALGDGYRVGVRIVTQAVPKAVQVPVSAVFPRPDVEGGMAVFLIDGRRARLHPVEVGARNGTQAWVRQGLKPGQEVIVYPPSTVADGVRVQRRKA